MLLVLMSLSTLAVTILIIRTLTVLGRHADWTPDTQSPGAHLPTVSVCIAARNETHALAQCLERVLKSDYKKIEVLVLDDSSTDDTSLIIKSFANAGVRFIAGKPLPTGWLGKNHAYQTLTDEASGDMLLFVDVDTHIAPATITNLVSKMTQSNISMLSVLPMRDDGMRISAVFGTMRYYWELLLGTLASPPAASAIWMVQASALKAHGVGLHNYGMSIRPERHLARQLQRSSMYRYVIGTASIGVTYEKQIDSQHETAIRLYYPATGRSLGMWVLATAYLSLLIVPLVILLTMPSSQLILVWALLLVALVTAGFGMFVKRTYGKNIWLLRIILGPLLIIQEIILLAASYIRYMRGSVTWKGRPVAAQSTRNDALQINE